MPERKYSVEKTYRVWDDKEGVCVEVGPDGDVGCLVQIRTRDDASKQFYGDVSLVMEPEMARRLADALYGAADDMEKTNG